uniref:DNA polymerase 2 n=1 Tax=Tricholoma saponaceum TaxID=113602 RepID=A0A6C0W3U7_9AGAR|nr:DNA polymerase 2 [Tricholoma saponaceum]QIC20318.1 DNA polymerase 2 [Tricholoma saponaceum]
MNNSNILNIGVWNDYYKPLQNQLLINLMIEGSLYEFWENIANHLDDKQKFHIQFKVKFNDDHYRSISYLQTADKNDYNDRLSIFIEFWDLKSEEYKLKPVVSITYNYKILSKTSEITQSKIISHKNITGDKKDSFSFSGYTKLPSTMDWSEWGKYKYISDNYVLVFKPKSTLVFHVQIFDNYHIDSDLKIKKIIRKTSFLKSIKPNIFRSDKFIVMDLETRNIDNINSPYCISIYDGKICNSFYLTNYPNEKIMLITALNFVMKRKFNQYKVFFHNFSYFDSVF